MRPPDELKGWSKNELVREVKRLRALLAEHKKAATEDDPRERSIPEPVTDVVGDPYATGGVILDARGAVLLDTVDVSLVDSRHDDGRPPFAFLVLAGRVNMTDDRVNHAYMMGSDGAAGIVSELIGLAVRSETHESMRAYGDGFDRDLKRRLAGLP